MVCAVEFEPAPAITGAPLAPATSTAIRTRRSCSSTLSVGVSPVVPQGTRPSQPSASTSSQSFAYAASSIAPPRKGVASATKVPSHLVRSVGMPPSYGATGRCQPRPPVPTFCTARSTCRASRRRHARSRPDVLRRTDGPVLGAVLVLGFLGIGGALGLGWYRGFLF